MISPGWDVCSDVKLISRRQDGWMCSRSRARVCVCMCVCVWERVWWNRGHPLVYITEKHSGEVHEVRFNSFYRKAHAVHWYSLAYISSLLPPIIPYWWVLATNAEFTSTLSANIWELLNRAIPPSLEIWPLLHSCFPHLYHSAWY